MKFRKEDLITKALITEKQLQEAQEDIDTWERVKPLFDKPEWKLFIEHVRREHKRLDSITNCDPDYTRYLIRKGEVAGMMRFLQIPRTLQQKATSGAEIVRLGLAQNKE